MKVFLALLLPKRIYHYHFLKEGTDVATPPGKKPLYKQSWAANYETCHIFNAENLGFFTQTCLRKSLILNKEVG